MLSLAGYGVKSVRVCQHMCGNFLVEAVDLFLFFLFNMVLQVDMYL